MSDILPDEDKDLTFRFIIQNLLVTALDRDINAIKQSKLKLKDQHALFMEKVREKVIKDSVETKREMRKKGVKVFDMVPVNEDFVSYRYLVRGYESEFRFFKSALKMHTEKLLLTYYFPNQ